MEYANNLRHEVTLLQNRVIEAIYANLKRIGTDHTEDAPEPLEFFSFSTTVENGITGIAADGTLIGTKSSMGTHCEGTIRGAVDNEQISLLDAISLLEDLEAI